MAASNDYNFDHPGAFDFELLVATLRKLKQGKSVKIPVYDFTTHGRQKDWVSCVCVTASILVSKDFFSMWIFSKIVNCLKFKYASFHIAKKKEHSVFLFVNFSKLKIYYRLK